jgi:hypothetical protein
MVGQMQLSDGEARMLPVQKFGHVKVLVLVQKQFGHEGVVLSGHSEHRLVLVQKQFGHEGVVPSVHVLHWLVGVTVLAQTQFGHEGVVLSAHIPHWLVGVTVVLLQHSVNWQDVP